MNMCYFFLKSLFIFCFQNLQRWTELISLSVCYIWLHYIWALQSMLTRTHTNTRTTWKSVTRHLINKIPECLFMITSISNLTVFTPKGITEAALLGKMITTLELRNLIPSDTAPRTETRTVLTPFLCTLISIRRKFK